VSPATGSIDRRDWLGLRPRDRSSTARAFSATGQTGLGDLIRANRPGMGSYFEIRLPARVPGAADLATRGLDLIGELEAQLTVYRDDSEVSLLNARAHEGPIVVEPGLFALLELAVNLGQQTGGAYDVAAGALSAAWGFTRGPRRVPEPAELDQARARSGSRLLRLDRKASTLAFDREGLVVNLGSIGKGFALDRVADQVRDHWWPTPALLHGGRSSVYALGSAPGTIVDGWPVALPDPVDPSRSLGTFFLRDRGLGTSGTAHQRFERDGRVYGHILDPRTGEPAEGGPASVTAIAPTAAEADALSTAFYLLGPERSADLAARRPGVGAVFVEAGDGRRLTTINLDRDEFRPAAESRPISA